VMFRFCSSLLGGREGWHCGFNSGEGGWELPLGPGGYRSSIGW
jgi:hypothetical protein